MSHKTERQLWLDLKPATEFETNMLHLNPLKGNKTRLQKPKTIRKKNSQEKLKQNQEKAGFKVSS